MSSKNIWSLSKPQRYKIMKGLGLVCFILLVSITAIACSRSTKDIISENDKIKDATKLPSDSPATSPTTTIEPEPTVEPTPTVEPEPTVEPTPTVEPEPTVEPTPTKEPASTSEPASMNDFIPSKKVVHSATAFTQGNYLFYKTGELTKPGIASINLKTLKVAEITIMEDSYFNAREFYLVESDIYYHAEGDIYRVGVDGRNKIRLYKGTANILGFHEDDLFALDTKTREIIRINREGENKTLVKLKSINTLEAVMVQDGIYYINKSSNNTLNGNDPIDRLYYINFDGKEKTEIYADLDVFDLKAKEDEVFFLAVSEEPEGFNLAKVKNRKVSIIHSSSKAELEAQGCNWMDRNYFTLLAVNTTNVFYGINFNNVKEMNIYSVGTDGENPHLYLNAYGIEGMNPSAYFRSGDMDEGYLKIVFDCDEDPVEVYFIDLQDKSAIKFEGGYYLATSIDVEGEYVYYLKSSQYDHYGEKPEEYKYSRSKISELK